MNYYTVSEEIIEDTLKDMKKNNFVDKNAQFNFDLSQKLRTEVTYHDLDFRRFLGSSKNEEKICDDILEYLKSKEVPLKANNYDRKVFEQFRKEVKSNFEGSWTSLSSVMERVLYMLTSIRQPQLMVECGSFWGNTLAWFAGPSLGTLRQYRAERIIGIDVDEQMCKRAKENFARLKYNDLVEIINDDARNVMDNNIAEKMDFLYFESKSEEEPDLYLKILKQVYDQLPKGTWIVAHDVLHRGMISDLSSYIDYVRNPDLFAFSMTIDVDNCGLELTIK